MSAGDTREALAAFVSAAIPVSTEIDPRGHSWCEAYLDQALALAHAALATQPAQPSLAGLPFAEAKARIESLNEADAKGLAISLLIQNGIMEKYAAQPSAQGEAVAWLVEWKADGYGPQWWGFNHTPGKNGTWCSDANNAIRFARKEDAERMRLHIIAVAGLTGLHDYERAVSVTEHLWEVPCRAE